MELSVAGLLPLISFSPTTTCLLFSHPPAPFVWSRPNGFKITPAGNSFLISFYQLSFNLVSLNFKYLWLEKNEEMQTANFANTRQDTHADCWVIQEKSFSAARNVASAHKLVLSKNTSGSIRERSRSIVINATIQALQLLIWRKKTQAQAHWRKALPVWSVQLFKHSSWYDEGTQAHTHWRKALYLWSLYLLL